MVTTTRTRIALSASCAAALALAMPIVEASPARAADTITAAEQPYFAYYHLDQARAKGYTGKGVTVAIIDGNVDLSAAELNGAAIANKTPCTVTVTPESTGHGTGTASILVARDYGIVPDATLLAYQTDVGDADPGGDCTGIGGVNLVGYPSLINHAINDGAQIINLSAGSSDHSSELRWAIARAIHQGVLITGSAGNEARDANNTHLGWWSGVVGVSAVDQNGAFASYSSWGQGVTTAAFGGPVVTREYPSNAFIQTNGTSSSAPIVAGFLALARQKWPDATANQLLQLLVHTTVNSDGTWNQYTGYGLASPATMINTDPSQYPDENPLADKGGGSSPTPEEVRQYADGIVDPSEIVYDNSYTYRGLDESTLTSPNNPYPTHIGTSPRYHAK